MTQIGVSCVRGLIGLGECKDCRCNPLHPCMLPADVLQEMDPNPDHYHSDPNVFSATGLLGCSRQRALKLDHGYYVDVEGGWSLLRGSMVHALMQNTSKPYPGAMNSFREIELETQVDTKYGPQRFISQPDLIVISPYGTEHEYHVKIVDYKSTGTVDHDLVAARRDHVRQINMYAWLVRRALPAELDYQYGHHDNMVPPTVVVDELEIFYCDMKKTRRFTSAGYLSAKGKMLTRNPRTYDELYLEPIQIYDDAKVDAWIRAAIEKQIEGRTVLAPVLGEDENWRCINCPVKAICDELAMGGV